MSPDGVVEEKDKLLARWQKMCEEFIGCSMLADEFAGEPHEPESFGRYVRNILDQLSKAESINSDLQKEVELLRDGNSELLGKSVRKSREISDLQKKLAIAEDVLLQIENEPHADVRSLFAKSALAKLKEKPTPSQDGGGK